MRPPIEELRKICQEPVLHKETLFGRYWARPICLRITWALTTTRVSPNEITMLWLALGLLSALLFATGDYMYRALGVVAIQLIFILDGVDGELARFRGSTTKGDRLEAISHVIIYSAIPLAFAVGLYSRYDNAIFLGIGFAASFFYLQATVQQLETEKIKALNPTENCQKHVTAIGETNKSEESNARALLRRIQRIAPAYPTSITLCVVLDVTWLWMVTFLSVFVGLFVLWTNRHLQVASRSDRPKEENAEESVDRR